MAFAQAHRKVQMAIFTKSHIDNQTPYRNLVTAMAVMIALASVLALLQLAASYQFQLGDVHDDAYISFRYAANLVHGQGLVYNPGEYVEGYTNFLWVMTSALTLKLGFDPAFTTYVLNTIFAIALLVLVGWFGSRLVEWGRVATGLWALPVAAIALTDALAYALINGLETTLFTLLLTGAAMSAVLEWRGEAKLPLSGVLFALTVVTRPEGTLFWGLTVLYQFISSKLHPPAWARAGMGATPPPSLWGGVGERDAGEVPNVAPALRWQLGGFLLIWLPYMVWKVFYYGSIFPNTFYDKATGNSDQLASGLGYVSSAWPYLFGPLAFALAIAMLLWRKRLGQVEGYFALLIVANFAYVAYVGGDYLIGYRFLLPVAALLALLIAIAVSSLLPQNWSAALSLLVAGSVIIFLLSPYTGLLPSLSSKLHDEQGYNSGSVAVINWLRDNASASDSLAIETAGRIPYFTNIYTIDMLGLTDAHIAHGPGRSDHFTPGHNKFDIGYVLDRKPTYIMVYRIPQPNGSYGFNQKYMPASTALISNPQFTATYAPAARFPMWPGVEGWLYKRNQ